MFELIERWLVGTSPVSLFYIIGIVAFLVGGMKKR